MIVAARFLFWLVFVVALGACTPLSQAMGPQTQQPRLQQLKVTLADGVELPMRTWAPPGGPGVKPAAVILALHGFNDYSNAFRDAGSYWAASGVQTYAYDQRGFGRAPRPGVWAGTDTLVADLRAVTALLRRTHPGAPLYLLGESMGGAVALVAMTGPNPPAVDGLILVSPAVWNTRTYGALMQAAAEFAARLAPGLPFSAAEGGQLAGAIRASDNIAMLRQFARDPLVQKGARLDSLLGLADLMNRAAEAAPRVPAPALILFGHNEQIVPKSSVLDFVRDLPRGQATVVFYPKGYHMLLRDLQGHVAQRDILSWTLSPGSPLPSGLGRPAPGAIPKDWPASRFPG